MKSDASSFGYKALGTSLSKLDTYDLKKNISKGKMKGVTYTDQKCNLKNHIGNNFLSDKNTFNKAVQGKNTRSKKKKINT